MQVATSERCQVLRRTYGHAFLLCWIFSLFGNQVAVAPALPEEGFATAHATGSLAAVIVAWVMLGLAVRLAPLSRHRGLCLAFAAAGSIGSLCLSFAWTSSAHEAMLLVGASLSGVSAAVLFLAWHEYLATQGVRPALSSVFVTAMVACAAMLAIRLLPGPARIVIEAALPVTAALTLRPERGTRFYVNAAADLCLTPREMVVKIYHDHSPRVMCALAFTAASYGLVCTVSILTGGESDGTYPLGFSVITALSIALAAGVVAHLDRERIVQVHYVALPCAVCGVCLFYALHAGALPGDAMSPAVSAVAALLVGLGLFAIFFMGWAVLAQSARTKRLPVLGLFASHIASLLVGLVAGQALGMLIMPRDADAAVAVLVMLFVAALLIGSLNGRIGVSEEVLAAPAQTERDTKVLALAEQKGLSPRETEVLQIWLAGHNAVYLEETLHISRNTVKTHLNHIYQKVGVSSKEELLALIGE